jgi:hypothetical protein
VSFGWFQLVRDAELLSIWQECYLIFSTGLLDREIASAVGLVIRTSGHIIARIRVFDITRVGIMAHGR